MNRTITKVFIFVAGAAVGSFATWKFIETKYKRIAQEEIDSVKEAFGAVYIPAEAEDDGDEATEDVDEEEDPELDEEEVEEYGTFVQMLGYSDEKGGAKVARVLDTKPVVIPPHEFGEADGYEVVSLKYFADGVLTDSWDVPVKDVAGFVGEDFYTHFGEYEEDSVFIRNDRLRMEFEILRDLDRFADISKQEDHLAEENDS